MKHLLNTLFVTSEDAYLTLDGENVVVNREKAKSAGFRCITCAASSVFPMPVLRHPSWVLAPNATSPCLFAHRADGFLPRSTVSPAAMCFFAANNTVLPTMKKKAVSLQEI